MDERPIGIFDSGLGGLTVARAVMEALPHESVVYFGDNARCPYGPRDPDEVRGFVTQIGSWLLARDVKAIVIACNTASAAGLELARDRFPVPVVDVVGPGARGAVAATRNRRVGVIGTVGTVESGAYSRAVRALDPETTVFSIPTPKFVDVVEAGLRMGPGALEDWMAEFADVYIRPTFYQLARGYLDPLKRSGIDTLVLGCTHFPLLSAAIQQVVGPGVALISSAEEAARDLADALREADAFAAPEVVPDHAYATTGDPDEFRRLGGRVLRRPIARADKVLLSQLQAAEHPPLPVEE